MRIERLIQTQSDERLALLAAHGHDFAFEELVRRFREPLGRYLRRLLGDPLSAEDVLERGLLRAWASLLGGSAPIEVRPWLYGMVHAAAVGSAEAPVAARTGERPAAVVADRALAAARGALTALVPPRAVLRRAGSAR